ncbi:pentapeptide repeat-containing protein [Actinomycetospora chibensis]|uniref:Pentapeptide repeat-containing protein n=2 Tax=Actinomycetospora chibensis TaxID=663606 RepID=A0ABV9RRT4_9PSEU
MTVVLMVWLLYIAREPVPPPQAGAPIAPSGAVQIDAIRTALTAGVGVGGAVALLLAFRRQRHSEETSILVHQATLASEADALERRTTELYTSAAEQLGSDKAPVRLAGLYALDRLGQDTASQRQAVVGVLSAYLRMPYEPLRDPYSRRLEGTSLLLPQWIEKELASRHPPEEVGTAQASPSASEGKEDESARSAREELEVRRTAQHLLGSHFRKIGHQEDLSNYWTEVENVDLRGADLVDFELRECLVPNVNFAGARFYGHTRFEQSIFTSARFENATFEGFVSFSFARFEETPSFAAIKFAGPADFGGALFDTAMMFIQSYFGGSVDCSFTKSVKEATFIQVWFGGPASFKSFEGSVRFLRCRAAYDCKHNWPSGWELNQPQPDGQALLNPID